MQAFGEQLCVYKPPTDTKTIEPLIGEKDNGSPQVVLNFITPHQKWGIHSTYTDNLLMLTLSRSGSIVWLSETDARKAGRRGRARPGGSTRRGSDRATVRLARALRRTCAGAIGLRLEAQ